MITDLNEIKHLGVERKNENLRFRSFLKGQIGRKVDKIVHKLNKIYFKKIDCTKCGNCCADLSPNIHDDEIQAVCNKVELPVASFLRDFTEMDDIGDRHLQSRPCSFLMQKQCIIYEVRPQTCRDFPHLHKSGFISNYYGVMVVYSVCPIVFNVVEDLKDKLKFKRKLSV
ncbi:MAG: YkgJ family cysteine cluster protein [Bacteroidales bacterium]|nr:YkgJ family cysteine cluster protein [Bacteroidales bacterium]